MSEFHVLCCRPEYFRPIKGDNGYQEEGHARWLENPRQWKSRLLATWDSVADELIQRGATLIKVPPKRHLPDQCFMADPIVFATDGRGSAYVVPSRMNSVNRQKEVKYAVQALRESGFSDFRVHASEPSQRHEGTGELHWLRGHDFFVQGYGVRSERGIGWSMATITNQLVAEVPLHVSPKTDSFGLASATTKGFHLDTLVMPLPDKRIIGCFERMHPATREFFEALYTEKNRIHLTPEEADLFIPNGLVVPKSFQRQHENEWSIFLPDKTPRHILDKLSGWGHETKLFDVEPSTLSGGGLHCMFNFGLPINRGQAIPITEFGKPLGFDHLPTDWKRNVEYRNSPDFDPDRPSPIHYCTWSSRRVSPPSDTARVA